MRLCWSQTALFIVIAVLGVLSMLSGCGAKGALYLPSEQNQQQSE